MSIKKKVDKLRILLQAGYDTLDTYTWANYSHFIDDYNDFYKSIKKRSEKYIQVLLFEYEIISNIEIYFYVLCKLYKFTGWWH